MAVIITEKAPGMITNASTPTTYAVVLASLRSKAALTELKGLA